MSQFVFRLGGHVTEKHTFAAPIKDAGGGGAYVEVPFDVEVVFGSKRPKVRALIEGIPYRGILTRMGTECHVLGIRKEIREQTGKTIGDEVTIRLELDTEPRAVEIPVELAEAFRNDPDAEVNFRSLAYTHQREYVEFINEAKKPETRERRVAQTIDMLRKQRKEQA
jgi:hypothetical protein